MKRYLAVAVAITLIAAAAATVAAQAPGWKQRIDRSTDATDPGSGRRGEVHGDGRRVPYGEPAGGDLLEPEEHRERQLHAQGDVRAEPAQQPSELPGLLFGGKDLDDATQSYTYFRWPQNGTWLVKQRTGEADEGRRCAGPSRAVVQLDASGKATNTLEVRVSADKIDYVVNGTVVDVDRRRPVLRPTASTGSA